MLSDRAKESYEGIENSKMKLKIVEQSKLNLLNLMTKLSPLNDNERKFIQRFLCTQLILEHRSSDEEGSGWHIIKGKTKKYGGEKNPDATLLSLFELAKLLGSKGRKLTLVEKSQRNMLKENYKWSNVDNIEAVVDDGNVKFTKVNSINLENLKVTDIKGFETILKMLGSVRQNINTSSADFKNFGNIDFVFFKLNVLGHVNTEAGFAGVAGGRPKFFATSRLFEEGWISFDDWLSYSGKGESFTKNLNKVWTGFPPNGLKVSYSGGAKSYTYTSKHPTENRTEQKILSKTLKEEIFFGEHIMYGIANTLVEHLRLADPSGKYLAHVLTANFEIEIAKLMGEIWKLIEAKLPGTMRYYDFKIPKSLAATGA